MLPKNNEIDAVTIAPDLHKVIFENDKVRVLDVVVPPGAHADMHWHPENVGYVVASGKLKFTKPDGTSVEVELKGGQVTNAGENSHIVDNIGETTAHVVQVELKI